MARTEQISLFLFFCVLVCCPQLITSIEGEGGSTNVCLMSPSEVNRTLVERFSSVNAPAFVNCLAYNAQRELERAVVSVMNGDRYDLTCEGGILTAMILNNVQVGITNQNQLTCLECDFNAQQLADVCPQRCNTTCEGCHSNNISMCSDCTRYRRLNSYTPQEEEVDAEVCISTGPIELLNSFRCEDSCSVVGENYQPSEEISDTCFACGLEYCVTCNPEEGAHGECITCLENTVLFEGECYAPPASSIACQAILQEEEEAEELTQIRRRQLELAIALPVVCFLIIVFFVGMSIFAHYQYPHIGQAGDKRHKRKQELEASMTEGDPNEPPLEATIWRSRPTIRYR